MIKAIIFDLDGTLINSIGGIGNACNIVLEKYGYPKCTINQYKAYIGNGLKLTIYRALPKEEQAKFSGTVDDRYDGEPIIDNERLSEMAEQVVEIYNEFPVVDTSVYDGIYDVLEVLKQKEIKWGIHTNKAEKIAKKVADAFFDTDDHCGVRGPKEGMPRKPHIQGSDELLKEMMKGEKALAKDEILFVGDTEVDIDTAKNLGVKSVAVSWGFRKPEFLEKQNPDYIIHEPKALIELIEKL